MGSYVQHFKKNKLNVSGYDGNPNTPKLTNNICDVLDLSKPIKFNTPFSWVMSLEVGEHLPKKFEDIFINNLHQNNKNGIVLSWAVKGQGGYGHFNEQNNDYIKSKICKLGYVNDIESENQLRKHSLVTIMVFIPFKFNVLNIFWAPGIIFDPIRKTPSMSKTTILILEKSILV